MKIKQQTVRMNHNEYTTYMHATESTIHFNCGFRYVMKKKEKKV